MTQVASVSDSLIVWNFDGEALSQSTSFRNNLNRQSVSRAIEYERFHCLSWNHTNQVVAIGGNTNNISLVQASNGQLLSTLEMETELSGTSNVNIRTVAFSNNSRYLSTSASSAIQLWDLKKRVLKKTFYGHSRPVSSVCFLPGSSHDVIGGDLSGAIRIWDAKTGKPSEVNHMLICQKVLLCCYIKCLIVSSLPPINCC